MNLYKVTYGEYETRESYIVAGDFGEAENTFLRWVGQQIGTISFVSEDVYIEEAPHDPR